MTFMARANHTLISSFPTTDRNATLPESLSGVFSNSDLAPYVELIFNTDGTWLLYGSNEDFLAPQSNTWLTGTGTSADYYIYADLNGSGPGDFYGSPTQTWLSLASSQSWAVSESLPNNPVEYMFASGIIYINYVPSFSPTALAITNVTLGVGKVSDFAPG